MHLWSEVKEKMSWQRWCYLAVVLFSVLFIWGGNRIAYRSNQLFQGQENLEVVTAKVELVLTRDVHTLSVDDARLQSVTVYFEATVLSGSLKGTRLMAQQVSDPFNPVPIQEVQEGDRITLVHSPGDSGEMMWIMQEYLRARPLMLLAGLFLLLLLLFGGKKGFSTILTLVFTCMAIFMVFIPAILAEYNIYMVTLIVCVFITIMTLALVNGFNTKSLSAAVGCLGGLLVAAVLVQIMDVFLKLTGYVSEESAFLLYLDTQKPLDLKAILFSGILIGALGAIMDVAVSMAASLHEIAATAKVVSFTALLRSGMNIGRDILGTMTNTLILAYIGGSLSMSLLVIVYSNSVLELLNRELIAVEILQALAGSVGLLCAIPLTALVSAVVYTRKRNNTNTEAGLK